MLLTLARKIKMRVCLLSNILPPYRIGFYNELARSDRPARSAGLVQYTGS